MKQKINLFILILICSTPLFAISQPDAGQISFGINRTSTDRITPISKESYDPGMGLYISYGLNDIVNLYAITQPFKYEDANSGEESSFSNTRIGLQYLWSDTPLASIVQQIEAYNYSEKLLPAGGGAETEKKDAFVSTRLITYLNFIDQIKPYMGVEYFFRGPPDYNKSNSNTTANYVKYRERAIAGANFEFTKNINLLSEYNLTSEVLMVSFQYHL